ncbi:MAG: hypothetical protein HY941_01955 [Gammaproteobacteria bacterium]|nr:hypothetical protein [Gammaproteobacteria bacterium]
MTAPKLVLHPQACDAAPTYDAIVLALRDLGTIGTRFALDGNTHFQTGPDFLDGIGFLGCAPSIQLDPPAQHAEPAARAGRFCHIQVQAPTERPRLRCKSGQGPRCRRCRSDIPPDLIQAPDADIACPDCGHPASLAGLNWRQSGGYARVFLDIWGIHAGEAVPSDRLLDRLGHLARSDRSSGDGPWQFFYIED